MLNCVYHPLDGMQVVDDETKAKLLATGFWFDHPTKAQKLKEEVMRDLDNEVCKGKKGKKAKTGKKPKK